MKCFIIIFMEQGYFWISLYIISICNEINFKGLEKKIYILCNEMCEFL